MIGLLGKKIGMTQIFDKEGRQVPVTLIDAATCHVTGLRSKEKDGKRHSASGTKSNHKRQMGHTPQKAVSFP